MAPRRRSVRLARALVHEARTERITFMAGSIAYHAFVSLLPLLLLVLAVLSAVGGTTLERGLVGFVEAVLTPGVSGVLVTELRTAGASTGVSAAGIVFLLWGTLRIFRGLDTAFSDIYESGAANTFADQLVDGLVVLVGVAVAVAAGALVESGVLFPGGVPGGWPTERLLLVVGLGAALLPMYYLFPDEEGLGIEEVLPGTVFAAVGVAASESLFGLYVDLSSRSPTESALASILVFLTWLYLNSLVILLGAVLNAVLTDRSDDVDVDPVVGGEPRPDTDRAEAPDDPTADPTADRAVDPAGDRRMDPERLRRLEASLADAEGLTVEVDGDRIALPAPDDARVRLDASRLPFVDGPRRLTLSWERE